LIILTSSTRKVKGPILAPSEAIPDNTTNQQESDAGVYQPKGLWNAPSPSDQIVSEDVTPEAPVEETPPVKPKEILEITFDEKGFSPPAANGFKYQTVRWTNKTDAAISIQQMKSFFDEFKKPVDIASGATLEFELTKAGMWGYKETRSGKMGSIFIVVQRTTD